MVRASLLGTGIVLEGLPTRKAGVYFVPEAHFLLTEFPAEIDFSPFPDGWKVDESAFYVIELTALRADLRGEPLQTTDEMQVTEVDGDTASNENVLKFGCMALRVQLQTLVDRVELAQPFGKEWDELVRLQDGEEAFVHLSRSLSKTGGTDKRQSPR